MLHIKSLKNWCWIFLFVNIAFSSNVVPDKSVTSKLSLQRSLELADMIIDEEFIMINVSTTPPSKVNNSNSKATVLHKGYNLTNIVEKAVTEGIEPQDYTGPEEFSTTSSTTITPSTSTKASPTTTRPVCNPNADVKSSGCDYSNNEYCFAVEGAISCACLIGYARKEYSFRCLAFQLIRLILLLERRIQRSDEVKFRQIRQEPKRVETSINCQYNISNYIAAVIKSSPDLASAYFDGDSDSEITCEYNSTTEQLSVSTLLKFDTNIDLNGGEVVATTFQNTNVTLDPEIEVNAAADEEQLQCQTSNDCSLNAECDTKLNECVCRAGHKNIAPPGAATPNCGDCPLRCSNGDCTSTTTDSATIWDCTCDSMHFGPTCDGNAAILVGVLVPVGILVIAAVAIAIYMFIRAKKRSKLSHDGSEISSEFMFEPRERRHSAVN